jgi:hypothetical protein
MQFNENSIIFIDYNMIDESELSSMDNEYVSPKKIVPTNSDWKLVGNIINQ